MTVPRAFASRLLLVIAMLSPAGLPAQAGPWVPLNSRLDGFASWLVAEGGLRALDPLTRPWRLAELRSAASGQDSLALRPAGRRVLAWLRSELERAADSSAFTMEVGQAFYRDGRRDSFREGGASGAGALAGIWTSLTRGPVVVVLNPAFENRLKDDPEFTGGTNRFIAGRIQSGYVAITGAIGDAVVGRMARQWGPPLFQGLQLSPSAYAEDQLTGTIRLGRLALTSLAQRLDDQVDSASIVPINRYLFAHRLTWHSRWGGWVALTESGVYGGPGRGFEPAFHAPLGLAVLAEVNESRRVNALWGAEVYAPLGRGLAIAAQGMIDDIQLDDSVLTDRRPTSGGFTLVLTGSVPNVPAHWSVGFTRVASLTYRNSFSAYEVYALRGVGLGRNFADYDQAMLRIAARPSSAWDVALDLSYLRQGSGDFRQPFPSDSVLAQPGQGFLVTPVRSAAAVRLQAKAEPRAGLSVTGEIGVNGNLSGSARGIAGLRVSLLFDALAHRFGTAWAALESGR